MKLRWIFQTPPTICIYQHPYWIIDFLLTRLETSSFEILETLPSKLADRQKNVLDMFTPLYKFNTGLSWINITYRCAEFSCHAKYRVHAYSNTRRNEQMASIARTISSCKQFPCPKDLSSLSTKFLISSFTLINEKHVPFQKR